MGNKYETWLAEVRNLIEQLGDPSTVLDEINNLHNDCVNHYSAFPVGDMLKTAEENIGEAIDILPIGDSHLRHVVSEIKSLVGQTIQRYQNACRA